MTTQPTNSIQIKGFACKPDVYGEPSGEPLVELYETPLQQDSSVSVVPLNSGPDTVLTAVTASIIPDQDQQQLVALNQVFKNRDDSMDDLSMLLINWSLKD